MCPHGRVVTAGMTKGLSHTIGCEASAEAVLAGCMLLHSVQCPGLALTVSAAVVPPGVHHVYFYLPNLPGGSRVLARLQRRWMPPSSTWLFPPRCVGTPSSSSAIGASAVPCMPCSAFHSLRGLLQCMHDVIAGQLLNDMNSAE